MMSIRLTILLRNWIDKIDGDFIDAYTLNRNNGLMYKSEVGIGNRYTFHYVDTLTKKDTTMVIKGENDNELYESFKKQLKDNPKLQECYGNVIPLCFETAIDEQRDLFNKWNSRKSVLIRYNLFVGKKFVKSFESKDEAKKLGEDVNRLYSKPRKVRIEPIGFAMLFDAKKDHPIELSPEKQKILQETKDVCRKCIKTYYDKLKAQNFIKKKSVNKDELVR